MWGCQSCAVFRLGGVSDNLKPTHLGYAGFAPPAMLSQKPLVKTIV
jgi:hypothetical protein